MNTGEVVRFNIFEGLKKTTEKSCQVESGITKAGPPSNEPRSLLRGGSEVTESVQQ